MINLPNVNKHMIGINNRNLETFIIDKSNTYDLLNSEIGKEVN